MIRREDLPEASSLSAILLHYENGIEKLTKLLTTPSGDTIGIKLIFPGFDTVSYVVDTAVLLACLEQQAAKNRERLSSIGVWLPE